VNNNSPNLFQINLPRFQSWLTILAVCLLLGSLGLGWIVKSALVVIGLAIITPIIGFLGFFWWLRRSIVEAECPVCSNPIQGVNGSEIQCNNCGEVLKVDRGQFVRDTPADTIDVIAVEVVQD
jgi:predicted nucleic acid-binding Zn ribbon protein